MEKRIGTLSKQDFDDLNLRGKVPVVSGQDSDILGRTSTSCCRILVRTPYSPGFLPDPKSTHPTDLLDPVSGNFTGLPVTPRTKVTRSEGVGIETSGVRSLEAR